MHSLNCFMKIHYLIIKELLEYNLTEEFFSYKNIWEVFPSLAYINEKWYLNIYFVTAFVTTFSLILTWFFTLFLYCFDFRANTYFIFVNYGCPISCQPTNKLGWSLACTLHSLSTCKNIHCFNHFSPNCVNLL